MTDVSGVSSLQQSAKPTEKQKATLEYSRQTYIDRKPSFLL